MKPEPKAEGKKYTEKEINELINNAEVFLSDYLPKGKVVIGTGPDPLSNYFTIPPSL